MSKKRQTELTEDMEVIGPGQMLAEARISLKLSQQDIAKTLNFTVSSVKSIEKDQFDSKLSVTFTRGYLKSYAKLVNVPVEDVLYSFELLEVAAVQQAEMQSFSRTTEKRAENNRLIWFSILVVALLVASTVVWWIQEREQVTKTIPFEHKTSEKQQATDLVNTGKDTNSQINNAGSSGTDSTVTAVTNISPEVVKVDEKNDLTNKKALDQASILSKNTKTGQAKSSLTTVIFNFSGDCWVNISDATGERVAWGIKKADYIMKISGVAPFNITLGKPELVTIKFAGEAVDMSQFSAGNIAKFTLPLNP